MFSLFFWKNDISICFVHKSQKCAIFGLTSKDIRLCDFSKKLFQKMRKTQKKKVMKGKLYICSGSGVVAKLVHSCKLFKYGGLL